MACRPSNLKLNRSRNPQWRAVSAGGYGLMLLIVFITSTILVGASLQMVVGSGAASYLGASSQDNTAALQLAQKGMEIVLADIQSDLNAGTTVDSSYTYTSSGSDASMPTDPASLGGGTTSLGSFSGSMTTVLGNSYLVKVTATVGSATTSMSKLVNMTRNNGASVLDSMTNARAAYSLRQLRASYTGSAIRVRRSSDDTEQDIGFDAYGNLDMDSLRTFLSSSVSPPLDSVGSAAAAFGLRKLRTAYTTNKLIRVRRSNDNAEMDIGYTSTGDLDVKTLMDFVGYYYGYVTTWYDQSGNGVNATQTTTSKQPMIVNNGNLVRVNNRPAIKYDGTNDRMTFSRTISDDFTIIANYSAIAGYGATATGTGTGSWYWYDHAGIVDAYKSGSYYDFGLSIDSSGYLIMGSRNGGTDWTMVAGTDTTPVGPAPGYNDGKMHWTAFTRKKSAGYQCMHHDLMMWCGGLASTASLNSSTTISIGSINTDANYLNGYVNEVLLYGSVVGKANLKQIQKNEAWYYNSGAHAFTAYSPPLDTVGSSYVAVGLRKLRAAYAGSAIKVRRSSDNTTQDIGFDLKGNLDVIALMAFVGSGSGYIDTWYDQSGNSYNLTQSTAANQPMIVNAGTLQLVNGKPSIYFSGGPYLSNTGTMTAYTNKYATAYVYMMEPATSTNSARVMSLWKTGDANDSGYATSVAMIETNNSYIKTERNSGSVTSSLTTPSGQGFLAGAQYDGSWGYVMLDRGSLGSSSGYNIAFGYNNIRLGHSASLGASQSFTGYISEAILYNSSVPNDNSDWVSQNILTYYAAPLASAYITKWYDQSGNGYDQVQTSPALQPTLTLPAIGASVNRPTINFNGTQYLYSATGFPTSSDYSILAVYSYFTNAGAGNNIVSDTGNGHTLYMNGSNTLKLWHNGSVFVTSGATQSTNTNYAVCGTFVNSTKFGRVYVYNISQGTGTAGATNSSAGIQLGAYNGPQTPLAGTLSEALIFDRVLTNTDRSLLYQSQQGYFGAL